MGTCSVHNDNQIHLIEFDEEDSQEIITSVFSHPNEIFALSCSFVKEDIIGTVFQQSNKKAASIWKIKRESNEIENCGDFQSDSDCLK